MKCPMGCVLWIALIVNRKKVKECNWGNGFLFTRHLPAFVAKMLPYSQYVYYRTWWKRDWKLRNGFRKFVVFSVVEEEAQRHRHKLQGPILSQWTKQLNLLKNSLKLRFHDSFVACKISNPVVSLRMMRLGVPRHITDPHGEEFGTSYRLQVCTQAQRHCFRIQLALLPFVFSFTFSGFW